MNNFILSPQFPDLLSGYHPRGPRKGTSLKTQCRPGNVSGFARGGGGALQPGGWWSHGGDQRQLAVWAHPQFWGLSWRTVSSCPCTSLRTQTRLTLWGIHPTHGNMPWGHCCGRAFPVLTPPCVTSAAAPAGPCPRSLGAVSSISQSSSQSSLSSSQI